MAFDIFKKNDTGVTEDLMTPPKVGAMEKMIANMIGFTPEQMVTTLTDFRNTIVSVAETMVRIETKLDLVLAQQKAKENDDGSERSSGGRPARRTGRSNSDAPGSDAGGSTT